MPAPELRVFADAEELGGVLAAEIVALHDASTGPFLLGCPGGRSLRTTYSALAGHRLDRLVVVMMDEYLVDGAPPPADAHFSCLGFARREIAGPLGLREDRVWIPDPAEPEAYDERIAAAGGVDLFLLASGASDGHVAMVGPGGDRHGRTARVPLADSTRRDNLATFPAFSSLADVPREGVSVGLGTIADLSRRVLLVLTGPEKRAAVTRLLALEGFDPAWPVSIVYDCAGAAIWVDRAALAKENP